ncbi:MAG: hypothetical protein IJB51_11025 [Clostridia bacterium]|nr:hypothetical protein [Clostridia bacterium]
MFRFPKRFICLFLAFVLLLSLCSCKQEKENYAVTPSYYTGNGLSVSVSSENVPLVTLSGMLDSDTMLKIEESINLAIKSFATANRQVGWGGYQLVEKGVSPSQITIDVNPAFNAGNLLSLLLTKNCTYPISLGNVTLTESIPLNYDLISGKSLALSDLFDGEIDVIKELEARILANLDQYRLAAPFGGLDKDTPFLFDAQGITLYIGDSLSEFVTDPVETGTIRIAYDSLLFNHLTIFDREADLTRYQSVSDVRHLICYPSEIVENHKKTINGMEIQVLVTMPTQFASQAVKERVEHLAPILEDIELQATGSGDEFYNCCYYAERVGHFMVIRMVEEDHSGMNSYQSDRIYVFDAITAENIPVTDLFRPNFNYREALVEKMYGEATAGDKKIEAEAISKAQIIPREDHFLIRYTSSAVQASVLYDGTDKLVSYADLGYENLNLYN